MAVRKILQNFQQVLQRKLPPGLPFKREIDIDIKVLKEATTQLRKLYHLYPTELASIKMYRKCHLKARKIGASHALYETFGFYSMEKNGSLWSVVDYWRLNRITKRNTTAILWTNKILIDFEIQRYFQNWTWMAASTKYVSIQCKWKNGNYGKNDYFKYSLPAMRPCNAYKSLLNPSVVSGLSSFFFSLQWAVAPLPGSIYFSEKLHINMLRIPLHGHDMSSARSE